MKRKVIWILLPVVALVVGFASSQWLHSAKAGSVTPYTLTEVTHSFDERGELKLVENAVHAVRDDGSLVVHSRRVVHEGGELLEAKGISLFDTKRQHSVYVDELTKSTVTYPMNEAELATRRGVGESPCPAKNASTIEIDQNPEPSQILGFDVVKVTSEETLGSAPIQYRRLREVKWVAPALNCRVLRMRQIRTGDDASIEYTAVTREVVAVSLGEPSVDLFVLPESGYVEREPSAVLKEYYRVAGRDCPTCVSSGTFPADQRYHEQRAGAGLE